MELWVYWEGWPAQHLCFQLQRKSLFLSLWPSWGCLTPTSAWMMQIFANYTISFPTAIFFFASFYFFFKDCCRAFFNESRGYLCKNLPTLFFSLLSFLAGTSCLLEVLQCKEGPEWICKTQEHRLWKLFYGRKGEGWGFGVIFLPRIAGCLMAHSIDILLGHLW